MTWFKYEFNGFLKITSLGLVIRTSITTLFQIALLSILRIVDILWSSLAFRLIETDAYKLLVLSINGLPFHRTRSYCCFVDKQAQSSDATIS